MKTTSSKVSQAAAKILKDPKASKAEKSVAAAALTQRSAKPSTKAKQISAAVVRHFEGEWVRSKREAIRRTSFDVTIYNTTLDAWITIRVADSSTGEMLVDDLLTYLNRDGSR